MLLENSSIIKDDKKITMAFSGYFLSTKNLFQNKYKERKQPR